MRKLLQLEVCAFHIESCILAEQAGASRVELCDNPLEGGTTPSYGTIKQARDKIAIPLYPLLRPRPGNFFYTDEEFDILREDIRICREQGCNGISIGVQTINSLIDKERMKRVVEWAGPMGVICNRVFDSCPDPYEALEDIIECGCERVLTSGRQSAAPAAGELLSQLVAQAGTRISIMPGAGINSGNLENLIRTCGALEYHVSARKAASNPVTYINPAINDYGNVYISDRDELDKLIKIIRMGNVFVQDK